MKKYSLLISMLLLPISLHAGNQELFSYIRKAPEADVIKKISVLEQIDQRDYKQRTLLMQVASRGMLEASRHLVKRGASVNSIDNDGDTPLKHAAWSRNPELIRYLVKQGADINARSKLGTTALWPAVISGRETMVSVLVELGADPNIPNKDGMSALRFARSRDEWGVARVLEEAGAKDF